MSALRTPYVKGSGDFSSCIIDTEGYYVACFHIAVEDGLTEEERAAEIVRRINAYDGLVEALEYAVEKYGKEGGPWNVPSDPGGWLVRARDAIAAARGEA